MDGKLMRNLFAAVIAVFVVAADFESSNIKSVWTELPFVAEAQSEPAAPSNSHTKTVTASAESSQGGEAKNVAAPSETTTADAAAHAATSIKEEPADVICEAVKAAAEEHDLPIGFFVRLLWQESRFRSEEVSHAGAQGIAQFMPQTAVEMGLKNPFDPLQAIPASAKFLRKLYDQFGNLGLAAAAYNAGGGRIEKWLSRRSSLPKETRAYVKIITGHKAEAWTEEESTVHMPTELPHKAPCEGVGGLARKEQIAAVNVDLTPSASALLRKAEAGIAEQEACCREQEVRGGQETACRKLGSFACQCGIPKDKGPRCAVGSKGIGAQSGKQSVVRLASASNRTKSSRAAREL
ncbi:lytic transglycosylase domain-containing protein [Bradyrhizobium sp. RDT10]